MQALQIFDNFLENPESVRESAMQPGFGAWRPNKGEVGSSVYDGMSFWGHHDVLLEALSKAIGEVVIPRNMFFRLTNLDTEPAYVHSDRESGDWTCICYLSRHKDNTSGTGLYKHRETGWRTMPSFKDLATVPEFFDVLKKQMVESSEKDWEMTHFVEGKWNRAVVFNAPLFHSRLPRGGFGNTDEDGRLVWACHFRIQETT